METISQCIRGVQIKSQLISHNISCAQSDVTDTMEAFLLSLSALSSTVDQIDLQTCNSVATLEALHCVLSYLNRFHDETNAYKIEYNKSKEKEVRIMTSKINVFIEFVPCAAKIPPDDLFSLQSTHDRWARLRRHVSYYNTQNPEKLSKKFESVLLNVAAGQAAICRSYQESNPLKRTVLSGFYALYYTAFTKKALKRTKEFHANPQLKIAMSLWNILENSIVKSVMNVIYHGIKVNKIRHLPRTASHILQPYQKLNIDSLMLKNARPDYVQVRLLSKKKPLDQYDSLILHIHGGGFVAMSSASHQIYTRKWVNQLNIPCLSIDYRKAPANPFPDAIDDVWQVYVWVLDHLQEQTGISPRKIFLAGDSAGANLGLALVYKAIEVGLQLPVGLFLSYPALNLASDQYTTSLLLSLEDNLLPCGFLRMCRESYFPNPDVQPFYMASPIHVPDGILQHLPPTRILVGDRDPLHDDCWRFTERLVNLEKDVHLRVYEGFIHGSLNMCYFGGVEECNDQIFQISEWMQEFQ